MVTEAKKKERKEKRQEREEETVVMLVLFSTELVYDTYNYHLLLTERKWECERLVTVEDEKKKKCCICNNLQDDT